MSGITVVEGAVNPESGVRIGIIAGRFNSFIVEPLERGCVETLRRHGLPESAITIVRVPAPTKCRWWRRKWPRAASSTR